MATLPMSFRQTSRSQRNLCKWLIMHIEVTGVEIATNLHNFEYEIEPVFVTEGYFFVGECSPGIVDRLFVH